MNKRRRIATMIIIFAIFAVFDYCAAKQTEKPDIERIVIEREGSSVFSGTGKVKFYAVVITFDGTILRNSEYSDVNWYIKTMDNKLFYPKINQTAHLVEDKNSKYYGCSCVTVSAPFGTKPDFYKVIAEHKLEPIFDQESEIFFKTDPNNKNFFSFGRGKVEIGKIKGNPPQIKEKYNFATDEYTITFPKSTYDSKYFDFAGWKISDKIYKPSQKCSKSASSSDRRIVAQWKPKFQKPEMQVTKGKKMLKLSWSVVAGANGGYDIYRSTKRKGKYKRIKHYWNYHWNYLEDTKVKKGKKYYYKIKAIKKANGRRYEKTSDTVKMGLKYSNVYRIKLNRKGVIGKVGKVLNLKAKVKRKSKRKYSNEKVSWYTTDSSIAKIGRKTGKIKLLKAGTCKVYCRSFNGQKSKEIAVTVR